MHRRQISQFRGEISSLPRVIGREHCYAGTAVILFGTCPIGDFGSRVASLENFTGEGGRDGRLEHQPFNN